MIPTARSPLVSLCEGPFGKRVGRSVTEARGQGSVVVVSAEQEASAATGLQYASFTSTCQFTLWTHNRIALIDHHKVEYKNCVWHVSF